MCVVVGFPCFSSLPSLPLMNTKTTQMRKKDKQKENSLGKYDDVEEFHPFCINEIGSNVKETKCLIPITDWQYVCVSEWVSVYNIRKINSYWMRKIDIPVPCVSFFFPLIIPPCLHHSFHSQFSLSFAFTHPNIQTNSRHKFYLCNDIAKCLSAFVCSRIH
jgi:hypothetical protein